MMKMSKAQLLAIELSDEEKLLLAEIEFNPLKVGNGKPTWENGDRAARLGDMLLERDAIPAHRKAIFANSEYMVGRGPTPFEQFERNDHDHDSMQRHPHFLKWLSYFIFGPNLPAPLIEMFRSKFNELGSITSGDYETLSVFTRKMTREFNLKKSDSDEVFRLCIEFEEDVDLAKRLRKEVMTVTKR